MTLTALRYNYPQFCPKPSALPSVFCNPNLLHSLECSALPGVFCNIRISIRKTVRVLVTVTHEGMCESITANRCPYFAARTMKGVVLADIYQHQAFPLRMLHVTCALSLTIHRIV